MFSHSVSSSLLFLLCVCARMQCVNILSLSPNKTGGQRTNSNHRLVISLTPSVNQCCSCFVYVCVRLDSEFQSLQICLCLISILINRSTGLLCVQHSQQSNRWILCVCVVRFHFNCFDQLNYLLLSHHFQTSVCVCLLSQ